MKKIFCFIFLFLVFISTAKASETFYLGDHVPDIYIYMDRVNKKVYRQFRMIYRTNTNELVYCIEPGATLSSSNYDSYEEFNEIFNITEEKLNKIKLIAYYGYNYKNHTDIKWYAITQYIIWKEIMPSNWDMYFVDQSHNRHDSWYQDEINEIYNLVNNHNESASISSGYIINFKRNIIIDGTDDLSKYSPNIGRVENNKLIIDNLNYGRNDINLSFNNYNAPLFYYNAGGQNILKTGDVFNKNINSYVYVTAGKLKVNECNENDFSNDFVGGTYEIMNEDDATIDIFTCTNQECITDYLPVGFYRIRVKELPEKYEYNRYIYDIEIKDNETSEINICSLPKKQKVRSIIPDEPIEDQSIVEEPLVVQEEVQEIDEPYEYENVEVINEENNEEIDVPFTSKYSISKYIFSLLIVSSYFLLIYKHENSN